MVKKRLTTAQAIVEFLKQQYVSRDGLEHRLIEGVFGIFGHGNVAGMGQALEEYGGDELPYLQPKNEQAMVHIAAAYAKAKNRMSTFACTSSIGPGATNMLTGAMAATINRLPVLLLPGDIFASRIPDPVLQQLEHPHSMDKSANNCLQDASKYWDRINRPEQILRALPEAMRVLADPAETGAVTISLPQDVQAEAFDFPLRFFEKKVYIIHRQDCHWDALTEVERLIRQSKRPMIIAGGGIHYSEAEAMLEELVHTTGIPVAFTQAGMGSLPHDNEHSLGAIGVTGTYAANVIARQADVVIAVGTRLSDFTTASKTQFQGKNVRFINVNVNSSDANKHNGVPIVADARVVLERLTNRLVNYSVADEYKREVQDHKSIWDDAYELITNPEKEEGARLQQSELIAILNRHADENTTVVHAAGGIPGDIHKLWRSIDPKDYHSEYGYSTMGYEIPGALGVKLANPEREVIALLGDGNYLMGHVSEIVTARQLGLDITIVLADNHGYQCIHGLQKACGSPGFGNEFRERGEDGRLDGDIVAVDYVANARSLGARAYRADTQEQLEIALRLSRNDAGVHFIYVPVDSVPLPGYSQWDVPVAEVSGMESVVEARREYEKFRTNE